MTLKDCFDGERLFYLFLKARRIICKENEHYGDARLVPSNSVLLHSCSIVTLVQSLGSRLWKQNPSRICPLDTDVSAGTLPI